LFANLLTIIIYIGMQQTLTVELSASKSFLLN